VQQLLYREIEPARETTNEIESSVGVWTTRVLFIPIAVIINRSAVYKIFLIYFNCNMSGRTSNVIGGGARRNANGFLFLFFDVSCI